MEKAWYTLLAIPSYVHQRPLLTSLGLPHQAIRNHAGGGGGGWGGGGGGVKGK